MMGALNSQIRRLRPLNKVAILPRSWGLKPHTPPVLIDVLDHQLEDPSVLELKELLVQLQRRARVLDTIVRLELDLLLEEV